MVVGSYKTKKTLKNGRILIDLPNLKAGSYTLVFAYRGSDYFAKSKAKVPVTGHA